MAEKKTPQRMCLGCREMKLKRDLIRIVRSPAGEIHVDISGKAQGRGAYVCRDLLCLKKALRSSALERAMLVKIPESIYEQLSLELEEEQ